MMERNCDKCVYGRRSGNCTAWNCKGTVTVEDIKAEARQSAIDECINEINRHDFLNGIELIRTLEQLKEGENNV